MSARGIAHWTQQLEDPGWVMGTSPKAIELMGDSGWALCFEKAHRDGAYEGLIKKVGRYRDMGIHVPIARPTAKHRI